MNTIEICAIANFRPGQLYVEAISGAWTARQMWIRNLSNSMEYSLGQTALSVTIHLYHIERAFCPWVLIDAGNGITSVHGIYLHNRVRTFPQEAARLAIGKICMTCMLRRCLAQKSSAPIEPMTPAITSQIERRQYHSLLPEILQTQTCQPIPWRRPRKTQNL